MYLRPKYEWDPILISPDATVVQASDEMDARGVGCLIVADEDRKPVGMLTDRDLTRRVIAKGLDAEKTRVGEVMTPNPVTAGRKSSISEILELMRVRAVRRIPLVEDGRVVGVLALDDLLLSLAVELWNVSEAIREELRESWRTAARRRRQESREEILGDLRDRVLTSSLELREKTAAELRALADRIAG